MRGITLFVLGITLLTLACGTPQQAPAPSTGGSTEATPKSGGFLTTRETADIPELDPTLAEQSGLKFISARAFDSLLDVKSGPGIDFNEWILLPRLAEKWEVSPDAKKYTFFLRKGVKFANLPPVNGRELTSADVKWSLEYESRTGPFKDAVFPVSNQLLPKIGPLDKVETPDAYTVVVHMREPFVPFLNFAAMPHIAILPHEVYDADKRFSSRPIGSGPWQLDKESSQVGTRMVYKKNPTYWQPGKPYLDEIRSLIVSDPTAAFAAFQTKQLDVINAVQLKDADNLKKAAPDAQFVSAMGNHGYRIYYNVKVPPLNNVKFRQAMSFATDREEFVRTFTQGQGQWGVDGAIPGVFTQEEVKKLAPYDPEMAKKLLAESGYAANPTPIECMYTSTAGTQALNDIQLVQAQWKKVGIEVKILTLERVDVSTRQRSGNFMMLSNGTSAGEPEPDFYFYGYFHSKSPGNNYELTGPAADAKLDELAEAQRKETDPAKRKELWRTEARYIHDNGYALWPYYAPGFEFFQSYVKGYHPSNPNNQKPTVDTWVDK